MGLESNPERNTNIREPIHLSEGTTLNGRDVDALIESPEGTPQMVDHGDLSRFVSASSTPTHDTYESAPTSASFTSSFSATPKVVLRCNQPHGALSFLNISKTGFDATAANFDDAGLTVTGEWLAIGDA